MSPLRLAVLNLARRKIPTLITLVSIAVGIAVSGMLLRLYVLSGSRFSSMAKGGDAIVGAKAGGSDILLGALNLEGPHPGYLPLVLYQSLQSAQKVKFADGAVGDPNYIERTIPLIYFAKYKGYRIIGTDRGFIDRPKDRDVVALAAGNWGGDGQMVVVGSEVARRESFQLGSTFPAQSWTSNNEADAKTYFSVNVGGILAKTGTAWDYAIYADLPLALSVVQKSDYAATSIWKANVLNYYLIYLKPGGLPVLEQLINNRTVGQVVSIPAETERLEQLTGTGRRLGLAISLLILLLGGLSVAAMTVTRFEAMTLQLAVLRALGFQKRAIAQWLIYEGLLLGVTASFFGALIDLAFFPALKAALGSALPDLPFVTVSIWESGPVWFCAILATVAAVTIPIIRLYGQDVHQSLSGA